MTSKILRSGILAFLICLPICALASGPATPVSAGSGASSGIVRGKVSDPTGAVLPNAQIMLHPGGATGTSNSQGEFTITNITPGTYTITVSYVGFANSSASVEVTAGQTIVANAVLKPASSNQQVVVSGTLQGDAEAINEQRTSPNILNVMTADTIKNLPNQSVASALGRMPGVTVQINEGEPQYVQIRGTEPRLSNTTLDGVEIPGPNPKVRQVDLWVIPGDMVGDISLIDRRKWVPRRIEAL